MLRNRFPFANSIEELFDFVGTLQKLSKKPVGIKIVISDKQIKHLKPNEISSNIVIFGTTSQLVRTKTDGLREIKKKYVTNYPSNITSIKNFSNNEESQENFLSYGSCSKNLYLLLLEDL